MFDKAFHVPGDPWVIDFAVAGQDGVFVSQLNGLTLDEIRASYPKAILTDYELAKALILGDLSGFPRQIAEEDYLYVRAELEIHDHVLNSSSESFKLDSEGQTPKTIYARVMQKCFMFKARADLDHDAIVKKITESLRPCSKFH
ncbi:hypothetical protein B1F69_04335 [Pseudomonas syringae]|uniref:hypothetical protein n=1 Tax=Pseudomonas syringae TaxID=317 RepID=UPI0010116CAC|nr:hypothetical protein [Pseudomonas syringae]RXU01307.1 hypothetical protein B1F69_04335 [Pseudomonas syringae]